MKKRVHVIIVGRVQGVWYRASTKDIAEQLALTGWVRNTDDGNVEAVFEGEEHALEKMISWCYQGPRLARVTDVRVTYEDASGEFPRFVIRY